MGKSWAQDPNSQSRAVFLLDSYFLFPQVCLLSSSFLMCSWYSSVICSTLLRLTDERSFHMSLASPPTSSLRKHGDVIAPCTSMVPITLCTFTSGLYEVSAHFIRPSWYVITQLDAKIPPLPRLSLGFLLKPFLLLIPGLLEHAPSVFFSAAA